MYISPGSSARGASGQNTTPMNNSFYYTTSSIPANKTFFSIVSQAEYFTVSTQNGFQFYPIQNHPAYSFLMTRFPSTPMFIKQGKSIFGQSEYVDSYRKRGNQTDQFLVYYLNKDYGLLQLKFLLQAMGNGNGGAGGNTSTATTNSTSSTNDTVTPETTTNSTVNNTDAATNTTDNINNTSVETNTSTSTSTQTTAPTPPPLNPIPINASSRTQQFNLQFSDLQIPFSSLQTDQNFKQGLKLVRDSYTQEFQPVSLLIRFNRLSGQSSVVVQGKQGGQRVYKLPQKLIGLPKSLFGMVLKLQQDGETAAENKTTFFQFIYYRNPEYVEGQENSGIPKFLILDLSIILFDDDQNDRYEEDPEQNTTQPTTTVDQPVTTDVGTVIKPNPNPDNNGSNSNFIPAPGTPSSAISTFNYSQIEQKQQFTELTVEQFQQNDHYQEIQNYLQQQKPFLFDTGNGSQLYEFSDIAQAVVVVLREQADIKMRKESESAEVNNSGSSSPSTPIITQNQTKQYLSQNEKEKTSSTQQKFVAKSFSLPESKRVIETLKTNQQNYFSFSVFRLTYEISQLQPYQLKVRVNENEDSENQNGEGEEGINVKGIQIVEEIGKFNNESEVKSNTNDTETNVTTDNVSSTNKTNSTANLTIGPPPTQISVPQSVYLSPDQYSQADINFLNRFNELLLTLYPHILSTSTLQNISYQQIRKTDQQIAKQRPNITDEKLIPIEENNKPSEYYRVYTLVYRGLGQGGDLTDFVFIVEYRDRSVILQQVPKEIRLTDQGEQEQGGGGAINATTNNTNTATNTTNPVQNITNPPVNPSPLINNTTPTPSPNTSTTTPPPTPIPPPPSPITTITILTLQQQSQNSTVTQLNRLLQSFYVQQLQSMYIIYVNVTLTVNPVIVAGSLSYEISYDIWYRKHQQTGTEANPYSNPDPNDILIGFKIGINPLTGIVSVYSALQQKSANDKLFQANRQAELSALQEKAAQEGQQPQNNETINDVTTNAGTDSNSSSSSSGSSSSSSTSSSVGSTPTPTKIPQTIQLSAQEFSRDVNYNNIMTFLSIIDYKQSTLDRILTVFRTIQYEGDHQQQQQLLQPQHQLTSNPSIIQKYLIIFKRTPQQIQNNIHSNWIYQFKIDQATQGVVILSINDQQVLQQYWNRANGIEEVIVGDSLLNNSETNGTNEESSILNPLNLNLSPSSPDPFSQQSVTNPISPQSNTFSDNGLSTNTQLPSLSTIATSQNLSQLEPLSTLADLSISNTTSANNQNQSTLQSPPSPPLSQTSTSFSSTTSSPSSSSSSSYPFSTSSFPTTQSLTSISQLVNPSSQSKQPLLPSLVIHQFKQPLQQFSNNNNVKASLRKEDFY